MLMEGKGSEVCAYRDTTDNSQDSFQSAQLLNACCVPGTALSSSSVRTQGSANFFL